MRTEQEMYTLLLDIAKKDERIRAVYMNGSRTNSNAIKDIFQDYDIVYVVKETESFRKDKTFINQFGKQLYMQYPEENSYYPNDIENYYGWLIQFTDGNRLDLHVGTLKYASENIQKDRLCKILFDKDKCLPNINKPTDKDYWIKKPTNSQFFDTSNEFWWCLNNVAKGLWREEILYTMDMINYVIRPKIKRMLSWDIGFKTNFSVNLGKSEKYMYKWLDEKTWNMFLKTYSTGIIKDIWKAVFIMCELFDTTAKKISNIMNIKYNENEANNSLKFLKDVYNLPKNAKKIY